MFRLQTMTDLVPDRPFDGALGYADLTYASRIAQQHREAEEAVLAGWYRFNQATAPADVDTAIRALTAAFLELDCAFFEAECVCVVLDPSHEVKAIADEWRPSASPWS